MNGISKSFLFFTSACVLLAVCLVMGTSFGADSGSSDSKQQGARIEQLRHRVGQMHDAVTLNSDKLSVMERQLSDLVQRSKVANQTPPPATLSSPPPVTSDPEIERLRLDLTHEIRALRIAIREQQKLLEEQRFLLQTQQRSDTQVYRRFDGHHALAHLRYNTPLTELIAQDDQRSTNNAAAVCELFFLSHPMCEMDEGREGMVDCINRFGYEEWTYSLPRRCSDSDFWRSLRNLTDVVANRGDAASIAIRAKIVRDPFFAVQVYNAKNDTPPIRVSAAARTPTPLASKVCKDGSVVHGTIFGYPRALIRDRPSQTKMWDFGQVLPGMVLRGDAVRKQHPLQWNDDFFLHGTYRHAFFGYSHYRGGWDCMRHIDILSTGTPPYIPDIENCDEYCLSGYPKDIIREAMELPGVRHIGKLKRGEQERNATHWVKEANRKWVDFWSPAPLDRSRFNVTKYYEVADRLHDYTKKYLWCGSVVASLLKTMGVEEPRSVLVMQYEGSDFMGFTITCGMSELGLNYTTNLHVKPFRIVHEKLDEPVEMKDGSHAAFDDARVAAGVLDRFNRGAVVGFRLRPPPYRRDDDAVLKQRMLAREFDAIIFQSGSAHLDKWLSDAVNSVSDPRRVAVIDGADHPNQDRINFGLAHGVTVVARELQDVSASECGKK